MVLVHGLCVSSRYFVPTAAHLAPHVPVYAPDLPGWGRSDKPNRVLTLPELADALAGWIRLNHLEQAVLVGNSMGCQTIGHLAQRYPELVSRVVLIGPTMDRHARNMLWQAWRLGMDMLREPPWSWAIHARDFLDFGPRRTLVTAHYALDDAPERYLRHLDVPALVVRGALDAIVSQRWAEEVAAVLPQGKLVVIPGAAHAVNTSSPAPLVEVLLPFISGAAPATEAVEPLLTNRLAA